MTFKRSYTGPLLAGALLIALIATLIAMNPSARRADALTVYSGRSEELIRPLIEQFRNETGIDVRVRYGQTAEMVATILEEGLHSPADVIFAQDAGALGALNHHRRLQSLPGDLLDQVPPRFRSPAGTWVGLSGRARVIVYNPNRVSPDELPDRMEGFCAPEWRGRIGWAPANGSFQAYVTALRAERGDEATRAWLTCMQANEPRVYAKNSPILLAVASGEVDIGLVNHYYLHTMQRERSGMNARNHHMADGTLINTAGIGILDTARNREHAEQLIRFLLSETAQAYFTNETFEYPLADNGTLHPDLPPIQSLHTPDINLNRLDDLDGTLRMLQASGIL